MIALFANNTGEPLTVPVLDVVLAPYENYQIRQPSTVLNRMFTGQRGLFVQNLAASGQLTVTFTPEASDYYVPIPGAGGGISSITAGDGLLGGTITTVGTISFDFGKMGEYPAPAGPYVFAAGTPVALVGGVLVPADASSAATMPCIGLYTGATDRVRVGGPLDGLTGLPADSRLYVAVGGGLTATPPAAVGTVTQFVGKTLGTTALFVSLQTPLYK